MPVIDTGLSLGEAGLRVHGASVREAPGAKLAFKVSLSPHSEAPVTVDYRTGDDPVNEPKAVAGEDYVATSGTLTFDPGETLKTVEVEVLADDHDESFETMRLFLSNAQGARIDDASGLGVIKNTGPIPKAWLRRFGRTVAEHPRAPVRGRVVSDASLGAPVDHLLQRAFREAHVAPIPKQGNAQARFRLLPAHPAFPLPHRLRVVAAPCQKLAWRCSGSFFA